METRTGRYRTVHRDRMLVREAPDLYACGTRRAGGRECADTLADWVRRSGRTAHQRNDRRDIARPASRRVRVSLSRRRRTAWDGGMFLELFVLAGRGPGAGPPHRR